MLIDYIKSRTVEFLTPRLRLREFVDADLSALRELETRPDFNIFERDIPDEVETRQSLRDSISTQRENPRTVYRLAITIIPVDKVKGIIKFSRLSQAIREWEIGWAMHQDEWGKGYATEAAWHVMEWAFRELNVHRIAAYCHAANSASVRVMEKLGMHQNGKLRGTRWLHGKWWDEYVYAILEKDWNNRDAISL